MNSKLKTIQFKYNTFGMNERTKKKIEIFFHFILLFKFNHRSYDLKNKISRIHSISDLDIFLFVCI